MNQTFSSSTDMSVHSSAIHALAEQYSLDENTVKGIYETELQKLVEGTIRITAFLPVLCVRHVKELIIRSRL